jgi:hypothetical protein
MLNSRGEWQRQPAPESRPLHTIFALPTPPPDAPPAGVPLELRPLLSLAAPLEKIGQGELCVIAETAGVKTHGRRFPVADKLADGRVVLAKWIRRLTNWQARQATLKEWQEVVAPLVATRLQEKKTPVVRFESQDHQILAVVSLAELTLRVAVDVHGVPLHQPPVREVMPATCARCGLGDTCRALPLAAGTALLWRRLGLVDAAGVPTRRGQLVSFFSQGDGLAVAAALEDPKYPLEELIFDLANLDAGFRFCAEENRWAGRLAFACQQRYGNQTIPGYLENGLPTKYGAGAEVVLASVHKNPVAKAAWVTDLLGAGDIDRMLIEWRSTLRQIAHAPDLDWPRWRELQERARALLADTESPTLTDLPPLDYRQTKRVEHRLHLRRY